MLFFIFITILTYGLFGNIVGTIVGFGLAALYIWEKWAEKHTPTPPPDV